MLLEPTPELEIPAKRGKTLIISVGVHVLLVAILVIEPGLFDSSLKRRIQIQGNDYEVKQLTELELQPPPRSAPVPKAEPVKPLPEPPKTVQPPPPEPPPPPPPAPHVIAPDDVLAPGAKPDGQAQASRGSSSEPLRQGGSPGDSNPQAAPPPTPPSAPRGNSSPSPAIPNTNPNALTIPNLMDQANRIADQRIRQTQRGGTGGSTMGPKTGRANAPNGQNFSADGGYQILSDTKGWDYGPYMNQVLNRVRSNWLIPERAIFGAKGRVIIEFSILRNGDIADCHIVSESGERSLDGAAKSAIDTSNPFQRLPSVYSGNELQLRFAFYYNLPVE